MSALEQALVRLAQPGAVLARKGPGYGVYINGDLRRRPRAFITPAQTKALVADGAIEPRGDVFVLSAAGAARVARVGREPFLAQHAPIEAREIEEAGGRRVAHHAANVLVRLTRMVDAKGNCWFTREEVQAAHRFRADWEAGQVGLVRTTDLTAPPRGSEARGPGGGFEAVLAAGCDARRRYQDARAALAAPLARVVERACVMEDGMDALEREAQWPARSGKLALKFALAQLAAYYAAR